MSWATLELLGEDRGKSQASPVLSRNRIGQITTIERSSKIICFDSTLSSITMIVGFERLTQLNALEKRRTGEASSVYSIEQAKEALKYRVQ
jgi:hypothetical protein